MKVVCSNRHNETFEMIHNALISDTTTYIFIYINVAIRRPCAESSYRLNHSGYWLEESSLICNIYIINGFNHTDYKFDISEYRNKMSHLAKVSTMLERTFY